MKQKLNYMDSIAQAYKLSLGDKFNVIDINSDAKFGPYFLCEDGMFDATGVKYPATLMQIISGKCFVENIPSFVKPIKCKKYDVYLFIDEKGNAIPRTFCNSALDYLLMNSGNMFKHDSDIPQNQVEQIIKQMKGE